jgi:hypothetical protein
MVKVENVTDSETLKLLKGGHQRPNFKSLPQIVGENFETFRLHALSQLGDLDPWDGLPDEGIQGLWNALCADYHISSSDKDGFNRIDSYQRFHIIKKLVNFSKQLYIIIILTVFFIA